MKTHGKKVAPIAPTKIVAGNKIIPKKHPNYSNESLTIMKIPIKKVHMTATKKAIKIPSINNGKPKIKMTFSAIG